MENKLVKKKDYIWNMIGSVCYSGSSFYYLMLVTRVCGVEEAGVFALAFATAQLLLTVGRFGVRTYQATDLKYEYNFMTYGIARLFTCAAMLLGAGIYVGMMHFDVWKAGICVWVTGLKMIDAVEDVFHGELQRRFCVDLMGKMLAYRNMVSCVLFGVLFLGTHDLMKTCWITVTVSLVFCLAFNGMTLRKTTPEQENSGEVGAGRLLKICAPIFVSTFLSLYLYNVPKYAIDAYLPVAQQTYYSVLFMPSFVITLFSEIITKPLMTTITLEWEQDVKVFLKIVGSILGLVAVGTVGIVLGGHLLGRRLLELIYAISLEPYKKEFIVLLFGGGISAAVYVLYNLLIAIRHETCIIIVYVLTAVAMSIMTFQLVRQYEMAGAAWSYLLSCLVLFACFVTLLLVFSRREVKRQREVKAEKKKR